jgi:phage terminase large subunit-like protein
MRIKSFELGAKKWKVSYVKGWIPHPQDKSEYAMGICQADTLDIIVSTTNDENKPLVESNIDQVFYHELVHSILSEMGHELNHDEFFVQTFSMFLHQYMVSKKESIIKQNGK